ncbi:GntR family transcriptional regulator [Rhodoferax sp. WC2427]|uniref:GntR family transcriptional regulator n=1 Tax=Rhodoferax sp. WC2427 TaxID=3234144 RepID=UPI00346796D0
MNNPTTPARDAAALALPKGAAASGILAKLRLDATTSEPYYQQLKRQIQNLIHGGDISTGSNLPSERVLAEALGVSRTTIKRCYNDLRHARLLSTHGRGGTQVQAAQKDYHPMGKLKGFADDMRERGLAASTQLVTHDVVQDRMIASIFGRPSVNKFAKLVRIRLADGQPLAREVAWYDLALAPPMAEWDTRGSVYTFLQERCGLTLTTAEQTIEAVMSSEAEAKAFQYAAPSPCLLLKRKSFSSDNKLVEYVESTYRGEAYAYRLNLAG